MIVFIRKSSYLALCILERQQIEELWDTVWGKRITGCREDISTGGIQEFRLSLGRIFEFPLLCSKKSSWSVKRRLFLLLVIRDLLSLMNSK